MSKVDNGVINDLDRLLEDLASGELDSEVEIQYRLLTLDLFDENTLSINKADKIRTKVYNRNFKQAHELFRAVSSKQD